MLRLRFILLYRIVMFCKQSLTFRSEMVVKKRMYSGKQLKNGQLGLLTNIWKPNKRVTNAGQ